MPVKTHYVWCFMRKPESHGQMQKKPQKEKLWHNWEKK